jgi:hypothetical protein
LIFYIRLFHMRGFRTVAGMLIACNVIFVLSFDFVLIFQCNPISTAWKKWDGQHPGTCLDVNAIGWAAAAINIFLDLATIILPLPQIAKLQLSMRKKIPLFLVFALGFL